MCSAVGPLGAVFDFCGLLEDLLLGAVDPKLCFLWEGASGFIQNHMELAREVLWALTWACAP